MSDHTFNLVTKLWILTQPQLYVLSLCVCVYIYIYIAARRLQLYYTTITATSNVLVLLLLLLLLLLCNLNAYICNLNVLEKDNEWCSPAMQIFFVNYLVSERENNKKERINVYKRKMFFFTYFITTDIFVAWSMVQKKIFKKE